MFTLYIVATPIGNLQDITSRALDTLKRVAVIYCEDTRVTRKLLDRYEITTPVKSYHQHSGIRVMREIREALEKGDVVLVTDAGTPGVADPGNELVNELVSREFMGAETQNSKTHKLSIVPIPGASAVTAAASICGFDMSRFSFLGYVPKKKGRQTFFKQVAESKHPVILYEAPYRIVKTLEELRIVGSRQLVVCRELTKQFESIYRGTIGEVLEQVKKDPVKGEYVIVIEANQRG